MSAQVQVCASNPQRFSWGQTKGPHNVLDRHRPWAGEQVQSLSGLQKRRRPGRRNALPTVTRGGGRRLRQWNNRSNDGNRRSIFVNNRRILIRHHFSTRLRRGLFVQYNNNYINIWPCFSKKRRNKKKQVKKEKEKLGGSGTIAIESFNIIIYDEIRIYQKMVVVS